MKVLVSSKVQIVLPATLRRRLDRNAGARLEVIEEANGLRLRVQRTVPASNLAALAGMVKAPSRGAPRQLQDFDPASSLLRDVPKPKAAR